MGLRPHVVRRGHLVQRDSVGWDLLLIVVPIVQDPSRRGHQVPEGFLVWHLPTTNSGDHKVLLLEQMAKDVIGCPRLVGRLRFKQVLKG